VRQELLIGLLGPDLLDYGVVRTEDDAFQIHVRRCFAYENVIRAGVGDAYSCGIFARVTGWLEALDVHYEMTPALGACMKVQGRACVYKFRVQARGV
jgi:hypothetical protein